MWTKPVCLESHSGWCQILLIVYPLLKKKKSIYHPPLFGLLMACKAVRTALFSPLQALLFCVGHRDLWICPPPLLHLVLLTDVRSVHSAHCRPLSSSHYLGSCLRSDSGCALVLVLLVGQHLCFLASSIAL